MVYPLRSADENTIQKAFLAFERLFKKVLDSKIIFKITKTKFSTAC